MLLYVQKYTFCSLMKQQYNAIKYIKQNEMYIIYPAYLMNFVYWRYAFCLHGYSGWWYAGCRDPAALLYSLYLFRLPSGVWQKNGEGHVWKRLLLSVSSL